MYVYVYTYARMHIYVYVYYMYIYVCIYTNARNASNVYLSADIKRDLTLLETAVNKKITAGRRNKNRRLSQPEPFTAV